MLRLSLSPLAEADLEEIWRYKADHWSLGHADEHVRNLLDTAARLANGDRSGRKVDIRQEYLKYPVGQHYLFYRKQNDELVVIRILHQMMDVERHL